MLRSTKNKVFFLVFAMPLFESKLARADDRTHGGSVDDVIDYAKKVCPGHLSHNIVEDDKKAPIFWFFGKSSSELCKPLRTKEYLPSPRYLESLFEKNPVAQLTEPVDVTNCIKQINDRHKDRGRVVDPDNDDRALVAEYYYNSRRLQSGYKASLETLASIRQTLGQNSFGDLAKTELSKQSPKIAGSEKWIESLSQTCAAKPKVSVPGLKNPVTPEMAEMIRKKQEAYTALWALEKEMEKIKITESRMTRYGDSRRVLKSGGIIGRKGEYLKGQGLTTQFISPPEDAKKYKDLWDRQQALLTLNPEFNSPELKERILEKDPTTYKPDERGIVGPPASEFAGAIGDFLRNREKALKAGLTEIAKHQECLDAAKGTKPNCIPEARAYVKNNTPPIPTGLLDAKTQEKSDKLDAIREKLEAQGKSNDQVLADPEFSRLLSDYSRDLMESGALNEAECRSYIGETFSRSRAVQTDALINAGITIGTMGLGSVVNAGRLAVQAGRVATLSRGAQFARVAMVGFDAIYAAKDVKAAVDNCGNTILAPDLSKVDVSKKGSLRGQPSCPGPEAESQIEYASQFQSCVTAGLMAGVMAVPVLMGNMAAFAKVRSPKSVLTAGGKVTDAQADEIIARIRANALPTKPGLSQAALDAQHSEAFKLANNLLEAGIYKPGMVGAADVEKAIAQLQDLFPGASRWTGAPKLDSKKAMNLFKEFADPKTPNAVAGVNDVLDRALKSLKSKFPDGNFNSAEAKQAIREAIDEVDRVHGLKLAKDAKNQMADCVGDLIVGSGT